MAATSESNRKLPFSLEGLNSEDMDNFKKRLMRTKTIISQSSTDEEGGPQQGELEKVLTTFDLISLGVGSCVGTGMYVVAGLVARNVAGPGVILSFIIAAMASILSGVCYAEFGVRVPKTSGSAYMYSYVTVGEFVAFLIGWNLILEYVIGSAAGASALSACFDALGNHSMSAYLEEHVGTIIGKTYPDFLGFGICIGMTLVMSLGVKRSVRFNNILNGINFLIWIFIFIASMVYADGKNWNEGGFAPYGASGIFSGAATCFYAFIGFDIIATTGAEARNPSRSIPLAIICSLVICLLAYITMSMAVTLVIPYNEIHGDSALMDMFVQRGFGEAKYIVAIGAVAALTVSLFGSMFPMPRVIYAMSRDGLLFGLLSQVNERTGTPLVATIITGALASTMSLLVGLQVLVEMMSIGTLLAYTLVSTSVLILRYQPTKFDTPIPAAHQLDVIDESPEAMVDQEDVFTDAATEKRKYKDDRGLLDDQDPSSGANPPKWYGALPFANSTIDSKIAMVKRYGKIWWLRLGFPPDDVTPNEKTAQTSIIFVGVLLLSEIVLCLLLVFGASQIASGEAWALILLVLFILAVLSCVVIIMRQPQNKRKLKFMAPAVPILPSVATFFNFYLMLKLPALTWARLGIWICVGLLLYFSFSMWNSKKEKQAQKKAQESSNGQNCNTEDGSVGQTKIPTDQTELHAGYNQANDKHMINGQLASLSKIPNGTGGANGSIANNFPLSAANGRTGKNTSPPGAPPSRPPLPKQESLEKYRQRSIDRNDYNGYATQAPNREPVSHEQQYYNNQPRSTTRTNNHDYSQHQQQNAMTSSQTKRRSLTRTSADEVDPFAKEEREAAIDSGNDYYNSTGRGGYREKTARSGYPDTQDRREEMTSARKSQQQRAPPRRQVSAGAPKVTYDSSMARPRPRPNRGPAAANDTNNIPQATNPQTYNSNTSAVARESISVANMHHGDAGSKQRKSDPFVNLEDQW